jgi:hypothetical protein
MREQESSTVKHALAELGEKARKLQQFSYDFPDQGDGYFLGFAVSSWIRIIAERSLAIAKLLECSDLESALVLVRTHREKCIDLALLCSWTPPQEAALRAHIFQRLRYMSLADRNPDIRANPTLPVFAADLRDFEQYYPDLYKVTERLDRRDHWSGLKADQRLIKAGIKDPKARKIQDLLSIEVHASLDLAARRKCTPDMIIQTANYVIDWIDVVMDRLHLLPGVKQR